MAQYNVIGHPIIKPDTYEKATGSAQYRLHPMPRGTLAGRILRSHYSHARIRYIDTSRAARLPGVKAVVTGQDIPEIRLGGWVKDRFILAKNEVRHIGEQVAAVAAIDEDTADEALQLIQVEYEELPSVFDPLEAMEPGAPLVHLHQDTYIPCPPARKARGNILNQVVLQRGNMEAAWRQADLVTEGQYSTPSQYNAPIQTHEAVAVPDSHGGVTLWIADKAPFGIRHQICEALNMPMSHLRVIATSVGGDFGSRGKVCFEPICTLLALKSSCPVHMVFRRDEEFVGIFPRVPSRTWLRLGVKRDGILVALEGRLIYDVGAYCQVIARLQESLELLCGAYRFPNFRLEGYGVYTNNPPRGHMRGPVMPQPVYAIESHMDVTARKLGLEPLEFRLKNCVEEGDYSPCGSIFRKVGVKKTIQAMQDYLRQNKESLGPNQGWGISCGQHSLNRIGWVDQHGGTSAVVKINEDGTVVLISGITDQGAGQYTVMAQIVAEVMGVPFEAVRVVAADTDATPYEEGTSGSRTTLRVGVTVKLAAEDARRQLLNLASSMMEVKAEDLEIAEGKIFSRAHPGNAVPLATIAAASLTSRHGPIIGTGSLFREERLSQIASLNQMVEDVPYGTHAALVEVDPETGKVRVLRYIAIQDVGQPLNPMNIEGQIHGCVAMGLGLALSEHILLDQGSVVNPSFGDYLLPMATEIPKVESQLVEEPSEFGPFGAKPVGEVAIIPVAPTIANAIQEAIGVRVGDLPITPEKILRALENQKSKT